LKVNTAGNVYYFCAVKVGERNGKPEKCFTRFTFGRSASERIKAEYLEQEAINVREHQVHEEEQKQPTTAAGEAGAGGTIDKPARTGGGIAAAITSVIFGS
jgi:hypothetical protein